MTTTILNTKISEVENKIFNTSSLVTTTVLNTKISDVENKIPHNSQYLTIKLSVENLAARLSKMIL